MSALVRTEPPLGLPQVYQRHCDTLNGESSAGRNRIEKRSQE